MGLKRSTEFDAHDYQAAKELRKRSPGEVERIIDKVSGSWALEGMPATEEDRVLLRRYARGEISEEQYLQEALAAAKRKGPSHAG